MGKPAGLFVYSLTFMGKPASLFFKQDICLFLLFATPFYCSRSPGLASQLKRFLASSNRTHLIEHPGHGNKLIRIRPRDTGLDNAGKTTILKKFNGEDITEIAPTLG
jgi:hypothetical protein